MDEYHVFFPDIKAGTSDPLIISPKIQSAVIERNMFVGPRPKVGGMPSKVILRSQDGRYHISDIGENSEVLAFAPLPREISEGYVSVFRVYSDDTNRVRIGDDYTLNVTVLFNGRVCTWDLTGEFRKTRIFLRDPDGRIVTDAKTVKTAFSYFLTLTWSGDLYFNHRLYMKNVHSIATVDQTGFAVIMNTGHRYDYYYMFEVYPYKHIVPHVEQGTYGGESGEDDRSLPVFLSNMLGSICLLRNRRVEMPLSNRSFSNVKRDIPEELSRYFDNVDYTVTSLAVSTRHFATLSRISRRNQEVHIWGDTISFFTDSKTVDLDPCFYKNITVTSRGETIKTRKIIVDIVASEIMLNCEHGDIVPDVFAINFDDNTSCLISSPLSLAKPFPHRVRALHSTRDGILVVTSSDSVNTIWEFPDIANGISYKMASSPVSFAASKEGYILVYPDGTSSISDTLKTRIEYPADLKTAGGIAEIYVSGSRFIAILKNGTVTMLRKVRVPDFFGNVRSNSLRAEKTASFQRESQRKQAEPESPDSRRRKPDRTYTDNGNPKKRKPDMDWWH